MPNRRYRITPLMRVFLWRLLYSNMITNKEMVQHLWGDDPSGGPLWAEETIKVMVCYMRKFVPIKIHTQWGVGYYVAQDDWDRLHDYLVNELKEILEKANVPKRRLSDSSLSTAYLQDDEARRLGGITSGLI